MFGMRTDREFLRERAGDRVALCHAERIAQVAHEPRAVAPLGDAAQVRSDPSPTPMV